MKTVNQIAQEFGVHPAQIGQWKREIQAQAKSLFEDKLGPQPDSDESAPDRLYAEIGRLKMKLDWLKKSPASACHNQTRLDRCLCRSDVEAPVRFGRRVGYDGRCKARAGGNRRDRRSAQASYR
jgi:transposase